MCSPGAEEASPFPGQEHGVSGGALAGAAALLHRGV